MNKYMIKGFLTLLFSILSLTAYAQKISGTLPVLYINTEGRRDIVSKEDYLKADFWLDPQNTDYEAVGSESAPIELNIRGRGNWTWIGFNKKPYKMKFEKKQALLGMKKSKHFALLAHADDELGFLRNTLGFELSRRLGLPWTPTQIPVELVLNGDYKGLYFLAENVRVDEDRVNIVEQKDLATDPAEITGGWLVEIDNYNTDPHVTIEEEAWRWGTPLYITYHTPEVLSSQQEQYLTDQMSRLNRMFVSSDKNSAPWTQYVDIDLLARYYIVQEILDDAESFHGSCYLYKDLGDNEKWKFGPVWDFGNSFRRGDSHLFIYENPPYGQAWIGEIAQFKVFKQKVAEVWKEFLADGYPGLETYIQQFKKQISQAAQNDFRRWPEYGNGDLDYDFDQFTGLLQRRVNWLCSEWGGETPTPGPDPDPTPDPLPEIYLRGYFNNWQTTHPFTLGNDGLYYMIDVTIGEEEFKIGDSNWGRIDFGSNGSPIYLNEPYQLVMVGENILPAESLENVDLILDVDNQTLTVVPTGGMVVDPVVEVFLRGDFNGWGPVDKFTLEDDGNYYLYDISIGESRFKVADADWGEINYGSNGELLYIGEPYQLVLGVNDNINSYEELNHVDIVFDPIAETLLVVPTGTLGVGSKPIAGDVRITGNRIEAEGRIRVYDMLGKLVAEGVDVLTVNARGLYIVVTTGTARKHLF